MINRYIDHTFLSASAQEKEIEKLCKEAVEYNFYSVCVNSSFIPYTYKLLKNTTINICSVVGFPLGAMSAKAKCFEAEQAIKDGANEIDMVINIGNLKDKLFTQNKNEITEIKKNIGNNILKVIIETCYLSDKEIIDACKIIVDSGADFIKTSTGFGTGGATFKDIILIKETVKDSVKIKASGGIRDFATAQKYINLGVDRIGTSNGIAIVTGEPSTSNY